MRLRQTRSLVLAAGVLLGLALAAFYASRREPYHAGSSATEFFKRALAVGGNVNPDQLRPIAEAFRKMGPDGITFLVGQLEQTDSPWKDRMVKLCLRLPLPERLRFRLMELPTEKLLKRHAAVDLLSALGPAAAPAIPALTISSADPDAAISANSLVAIRQVGAPVIALPILTKGLHDPRAVTAASAAWSVYDLAVGRTDCSSAIPALRETLQRPTRTRDGEHLWFETARALSFIDPAHSADLIMPAILGRLQEQHVSNHFLSAGRYQLWLLEIVGNLGPAAKDAAPAVKTLANATDDHVRQAAQRTLEKIQAGAEFSPWP